MRATSWITSILTQRLPEKRKTESCFILHHKTCLLVFYFFLSFLLLSSLSLSLLSLSYFLDKRCGRVKSLKIRHDIVELRFCSFLQSKQRKVTSIKGSRDEGNAIFVNDSGAEREENASMNASSELLVASDVSSTTLFYGLPSRDQLPPSISPSLTAFCACSTSHSRWCKYRRIRASDDLDCLLTAAVGPGDTSAFSFSIYSSGSPTGPRRVDIIVGEWPKYSCLEDRSRKKPEKRLRWEIRRFELG